MKKFFIAALAATAMVSSANAGSISLDMRADHQSDNYNDAAAARNTSRYYFKIVRVNYEGKVNDDLSFRIRGAYNKAGTQVSTTGDSSQTALEYAYLAHKMGDFTLSLGRIGSEHGGFEAATSGADLYLTSQAYTKASIVGTTPNTAGTSGSLGGAWLSSSSLLYVTGAKLTYNFLDNSQSFAVVAFETPATATGTDNANMTGLIYKGSFMDKSFKAILSYHTGNGQTVTADKYELMTAGVAWANSMLGVSVDYISTGFKADASGLKDVATSIVGKFAYTGMEMWTPRLEVVSSENKIEIGGTSTTKFMGYGAVAEFRPYADTTKDFRYHVAYHNITQDQATAGDAIQQEITVGARLYADFLK